MTRTLTPRSQTKAIAAKLERIRSGQLPRTVDLFARCGGLSLGLHSAGFNLTAAVEFDPHAPRSHARNFLDDEHGEHGQAHDITEVSPKELVDEFGLGRSVARSVDVLVGGSLCQAFAKVGRAKLREVDQHSQAFKLDARGNLYLCYLHYIDELQPLVVVIENVPDMMNYGGYNIAEEVCEVLEDKMC